jgi:hypothetical protein
MKNNRKWEQSHGQSCVDDAHVEDLGWEIQTSDAVSHLAWKHHDWLCTIFVSKCSCLFSLVCNGVVRGLAAIIPNV